MPESADLRPSSAVVLALLLGCGTDDAIASGAGSTTSTASTTSTGAAESAPVTSGSGDGEVSTTKADPGPTNGTSTHADADAGTDDGDGEARPGISVVGTASVWDADGLDITIARPERTQEGDLLVLLLHRTDDDLPLFVSGWTRVAECYKLDNIFPCSTEADCTVWHDADYCEDFGGNGGGNGHDLAQSIFVKVVEADEPSSYTFDLDFDPTGHPGWILLTALRGADTVDPVRDWSHKGCDLDPRSVFPAVDAMTGDYLLLSQSFDDAIGMDAFTAPAGMVDLGYVSDSDEAGFLFGGPVYIDGPTGSRATGGPGGPFCKDALVSLAIKPAERP